LEELALQRFAVGEVSVVAQRDAERRIDVERLRFAVGERRTGRRVATVPDAGIAEQIAHVTRAEHVADVARALPHVEYGALARGDARGILTAMLQEQQPVVEQLIDGRMSNGADDTAHSYAKPYAVWAPPVDPRANKGADPPIAGAARVVTTTPRRRAAAPAPSPATN